MILVLASEMTDLLISMVEVAMSLMEMMPSSSLCSSVMARVSTLVSRMRLHAVKRLVSASMPSWRWMERSLICGRTLVMRAGSLNPKCLSTNWVSRLRAPARRAS